jgi:hypothetical protein
MKEPEEEKLFPVRMLHGYFPGYDKHPKHSLSGDPIKVQAGEVVKLPISEARKLIDAKQAERADEWSIE